MDNKTFRKTLAERLGRTTKDTDTLVSALSMLLAENATALKAFAIPGFGTFVPEKHDEQIVSDLTTGHRILLPPEITLEFFPGSAFRKKAAPDSPTRTPGPTPSGGVTTLPAAADSLASINSIGRDSAEKFLKEFFALIEDECALNGHVSIKGFGEFTGILFKPDKSLADEVNQPFAMFEPVELEDSVSESDLEEPQTAEGIPAITATAQPTSDDGISCEAPTSSQQDMEAELPEATASAISENTQASAPIAFEENTTPQEWHPTPFHRPARRRAIVLTTVLISILAFITGFISGRYTTPKEIREIIRTDTIVNTVHDTIIAQAPVAQSTPKSNDEPIYDTVSPTRYLASMARQYYGRMEYWVYIYKANEDKLGNPDKIRPGTRVKIPPFKEYATSPNDSVNLTHARRMAEEIYSHYKR